MNKIKDEYLKKIVGGAYAFVDPDGAGEHMRDMAVELLELRSVMALLKNPIESINKLSAELSESEEKLAESRRQHQLAITDSAVADAELLTLRAKLNI